MSRKSKMLNRYTNLPRKRKTGCDNGGTPLPLPSPDMLVDAQGRVIARADTMEPELQEAIEKILGGIQSQ